MAALETVRAAGSRSRAASDVAPELAAMRRRVPRPSMPEAYEMPAVGAVGAALHAPRGRSRAGEVDLEEAVRQATGEPGQEPERLERLERPDDARRGPEHPGLGAGRPPSAAPLGKAQR